MPLKIHPIDEPAINLTPMLDVVFNLIIFFMVGTQFADRERQMDVQLPRVSEGQPLTTGPDEIVVNVFADGRIVVSDRTLSLDELESRLKDAKARYDEQSVMIRGDGRGVYQHVMDVISACHRARIRNFSLATRVSPESPQ
jgi:biopolymer transport protein ExbD